MVPKKPTEYDEAVKSVQQWNEALKSSGAGSLRKACRPTSSSPVPGRRQSPPVLATPARRPLNLVKPRVMTDQFRSPDNTTNDKWDDDFVSAISPSALQLPHLRPHDNFGGLLSSEKLKAFASFETVTEEMNWDNNFVGDLTVKNPPQPAEYDVLETIRPYNHKNPVNSQIKAIASSKPTEESKTSRVNHPSSPLPRPPQKPTPATKRAAWTKPGSELMNEESPVLAVGRGPVAGNASLMTKVGIYS